MRWVRALGVMTALVFGTAVAVSPAATAANPRRSAAVLQRAWTVSVGPARPVATPVVSGDRAFTTDGSFITAVGLTRGNIAWQVEHVDPTYGYVALGVPSLVNGKIWASWRSVRDSGTVVHDPKTGAFTLSHGDTILGHVVTHRGQWAWLHGNVVDGNWYVELDYGGQHPGFIDQRFGSPLPYSDPVFASSRHVWIGYGNAVWRFDPSGECVAPPVNVPYCAPNTTAPLAGNVVGLARGTDDTLVATTDNGVVEVLDGVSGAELWRATPGTLLAPPAVASGVIVVGGADGQVHAYDARGCGSSTCAPSWSADAGAAIATPPAFGIGTVFVATADGHVFGFAAAGCGAQTCAPTASGHTTSAVAITGGPVVAGDGTIVVGTARGNLAAFRAP